VVISHANFVSAVAASQVVVGINSEDSVLSYLPMAHVFEKILQGFTKETKKRRKKERKKKQFVSKEILLFQQCVLHLGRTSDSIVATRNFSLMMLANSSQPSLLEFLESIKRFFLFFFSCFVVSFLLLGLRSRQQSDCYF
jgi:hypothetical protein